MKTPLLLLVYNRYEETKKIIKILKEIKPKQIYISADGPKFGNHNDNVKCAKVRELLNQIDWECKIYKNYNTYNLGCKLSVVKSINWFFKKVKQGIILEDDCIPNKDFFRFCNLMLNRYKNNKNIFCISGSNYNKNIVNKSSYYFSKYPHCWGWATWRRAWKYNKLKINYWPKYKNTYSWKKLHSDNLEKIYWEKIFTNTYKNYFNSWAYPWTLSVWKNSGLTIIPRKNLIKNIGVGGNSENNFFSNKNDIYPSYFLSNISKHPKVIKVDEINDLKVFYSHYKPFNYLYPWRAKHLFLILLKNPILFARKLFRYIL